ncbi:MAG: SidA/IucD/PvdA family monooxygenase [Dehalococcoidia bacterium]|nr:SidA/IucD/PvdA family monooxygenase [Dehalococcoidia bacterium]
MPDNDVYDITILGAGPAGLFGAFYAGMRGLRTKLIESLPQVGGQLAVLYPEKLVYDVAGHPRILAKDLVSQLSTQGLHFGPTVCLDERVELLARREVGDGEEAWVLKSDRTEHLSRTVVITAGIGAFAPNKLEKPGVAHLEGRGVEYFVGDKLPLRGKRILIVGGGDSAVDWCLNLKDWAESITLVHRRDQFRAHEASLAELRLTNIPVLTFWELKRAHGKDRVEGATIFNNKTGEEREIEVDAILVNIGFKASLGSIVQWGLDMADSRHIKVSCLQETNLPGVFAAGDIASVEGNEALSLIATGFGQAAIASNAAASFLKPEARLFPGHSSEMRL